MKILTVLAILGTLALTACEMPEEPDSYSEQGKTTQEADAPAPKAEKKPKKPQWVGRMNSVYIGMSQNQVKGYLGKPDDTDSTEMEDFEGGTTVMDTWTYGDMFDDADGDAVWILSFTDGVLDSKSRI